MRRGDTIAEFVFVVTILGLFIWMLVAIASGPSEKEKTKEIKNSETIETMTTVIATQGKALTFITTDRDKYKSLYLNASKNDCTKTTDDYSSNSNEYSSSSDEYSTIDTVDSSGTGY